MTAFVILAAGRGSRMGRVGESLHKALVPLGGKAVISHIIDRAPHDARLIVATGFRAEQVELYLKFAHPDVKIETVYVHGWDQPGGGPGHSLLASRTHLRDGEDLAYASCDTLWEPVHGMWEWPGSWAAVAPVPAGTPPARWCRLKLGDKTLSGYPVREVVDKRPDGDGDVFVGLAYVKSYDQPAFWVGIENQPLHAGERRDPSGLVPLVWEERLFAHRVDWTDIGDEAAYRRAVARVTGYDWTKPNEATYVLPEDGRVVKYWWDEGIRVRRQLRGRSLEGAVPKIIGGSGGFLAYEFVEGESGYAVAERDPKLVERLLGWADDSLWMPVEVTDDRVLAASTKFYRDKTLDRISQLPADLRYQCYDVVSRVDWRWLAAGCDPVTFHGDFNLGNVLVTDDGFIGIDWREDFAGYDRWGDRRYDLGKLLAGFVVHWENARRGDTTPWPAGPSCAAQLFRHVAGTGIDDREVNVIGALSLLNCAPLHAPPLDEVLVARGCAWLEEWV